MRVLFCLFGFPFCGSTHHAAAQDSTVVRGTVTDPTTGLPLREATVEFVGSTIAVQTAAAVILRIAGFVIVMLLLSGCGDSTGPSDALTVETDELQLGRRNVAYAAQLEASGGSAGYRWTLEDGRLPPGLSLDEQGLIAGTPASEGGWHFTVRVTDSREGFAERDLSLLVCAAPLQIPVGSVVSPLPLGGTCDWFIPAGEDHEYWMAAVLGSATHEYVDVTLSVRAHNRGDVTPHSLRSIHSSAPTRIPRVFLEAVGEQQATTQAHIRQLDRLRQQFLDGHMPTRPLRLVSEGPKPSPPAQRNFNMATTCEGAAEIVDALLVAESEHVAVYQDGVQHETEPADPIRLQLMLDYYEAYGVEVIDDFFGGLSDFNGDGKIVVLVTPDSNENFGAWVSYKDLLRQHDCPNSNDMELVYMRVTMVNTTPEGNYSALGLLVHEAKHASSFAYAFAGRGFHPGWIEEGTAEIAGETSSRLAMAATGGPSPDETIRNTCFGCSPEMYYVALNILSFFKFLFIQPPTSAILTYSGGWIFHRFLGDQYGNAAFFKPQNTGSTAGTSAFPNLTGGKTFPELMVDHTESFLLNLAGHQSDLTSYDVASIFTAEEWPDGYPWPVVDTGFVTFDHCDSLQVMSMPLYRLTSDGIGDGISVNLHSSTTIPPGTGRLVILRVR